MSGAKGGGRFFAVDKRIWHLGCDQGLNQAVSYLVMACGSGGDNRTTSWSTHAIETYTGISRGRAKAAIADLKGAGLAVQAPETDDRPRYKLATWADLPQSETRPYPDYPMTK